MSALAAAVAAPQRAPCAARTAQPKSSRQCAQCASNFFRPARRLTAAGLCQRLAERRAALVVPRAAAEVEITVEEDAMEKMEKSLESVKRSFATVRTGRANPAMLDRIEFDYYGAMTPLRTVANVNTPDSTLLVIQPYDNTAIPAIERAIMQSDLGLTPNNDGRIIRLQVPQLTAERRKEMVKTVSKLGEEGKVAVRNLRRDAMKAIEKLEKDGAIGEDRRKDLEDSVQKLTDDYVKQIEGLIKAKSDELTKV